MPLPFFCTVPYRTSVSISHTEGLMYLLFQGPVAVPELLEPVEDGVEVALEEAPLELPARKHN